MPYRDPLTFVVPEKEKKFFEYIGEGIEIKEYSKDTHGYIMRYRDPLTFVVPEKAKKFFDNTETEHDFHLVGPSRHASMVLKRKAQRYC